MFEIIKGLYRYYSPLKQIDMPIPKIVEYNWNEKLSPSFSLGEMTKARTEYLLQNRAAVDKDIYGCLKHLCNELLEPIRHRYGIVIISSAFRCVEYNKAVGGSVTSQHRFGQAADFELLGRERGLPLREVFDWLYKQSGLKFGQIVFELDEWIHLSLGEPYRPKEKCMEVLEYMVNKEGKKEYIRIQ